MNQAKFKAAVAAEIKKQGDAGTARGVLPDVLDALFQEVNFEPFAKENGKIKLNAKGNPVLDWGNVLQGIFRLATKLVAIYYARHK
jgi:hypothetical protein